MVSSPNVCFLKSEKRQRSKKSKYSVGSVSCDPVPVTAISCNHVSVDVTRGDRTKEDASTSHPDRRMKKTRGKKKNPLDAFLTEAAGYDVPVSEGIIRCEDRIRLRSNKDMRRHTVDSFRFRISLKPV